MSDQAASEAHSAGSIEPPFPPKKKEGWLGVIVTAVICGAFLFVWFQPEKLDPAKAAEPSSWINLANQQQAQPTTLQEQFDVCLTALMCQQIGDKTTSLQLSKGLSIPALQKAVTAKQEPIMPFPTADLPASIRDKCEEALAAADGVDIPQAEALLRQTVNTVSTDRTALLHLAAVLYRCGLSPLARETLLKATATTPTQSTEEEKAWLHLAQTGAVQPVLSWLEKMPPEKTEHILSMLVQATAHSIFNRESSEAAIHGSRFDPGSTNDTPAAEREKLWQLVHDGDVLNAWKAAKSLPKGTQRAQAFHLIARALLWLRLE